MTIRERASHSFSWLTIKYGTILKYINLFMIFLYNQFFFMYLVILALIMIDIKTGISCESFDPINNKTGSQFPSTSQWALDIKLVDHSQVFLEEVLSSHLLRDALHIANIPVVAFPGEPQQFHPGFIAHPKVLTTTTSFPCHMIHIFSQMNL